MRKEVQATTTRIVNVCDICERDCSNGFANTCYICRRECCLTCSRLIEFCDIDRVRDNRIVELPLKICCDCESRGETNGYVQRLSTALAVADVQTVVIIEQWRKLVKPQPTATR